MERIIKKDGFSLIELVITLALIAIIAIVTVIRWPSKSIELNAITHQVANDIRYAQALSMSLNEHYRINFASNNYTIADGNGVAIKHPAANSTDIQLGNGLTFNNPPTPNCIAFDGRGEPCDCSSGTLLGSETIQLAAGSATSNITVTQTTGYVSISP